MEQERGELDELGVQFDVSIHDNIVDRAEQARSLFAQYDVDLDNVTSDICSEVIGEGIQGEFYLYCTGGPLASMFPPSAPEEEITVRVDDSGQSYDDRFDVVDDEDVQVESVEYRFEIDTQYVAVEFPDEKVAYRIRDEFMNESVEDYFYGKEKNENYLGREGTPSDTGTIGLVDEDDVEIRYQVRTEWDGRMTVYFHHNIDYYIGPGVNSQSIATLH